MMFLTIINRKVKKIFFLYKQLRDQNYFIPYKGFKKVDLLLYDDIFPHPVSGFRHEEFKIYLSVFQKSKILTTASSYPIVKTPIEYHKKHIEEFLLLNKGLKSKLKLRKGFVNINTKLFYCIFLNNIFITLNWIEKFKIPFVFTLYPGGGFQIDDIASDLKLQEVFNSPMFRKVIVTQLFTRDYLIKKELCKAENIEFIFGGVVPQNSLDKQMSDKKTYLLNKPTFDICFCAAKYMSKGEDKGYDVFIEAAHTISEQFDFVRLHVVGGFVKEDIDITKIEHKIKFYGYQNFENLAKIFKKNDVIVSPNKPFLLSRGAFDGFPLGTVVEGVLNGAVALITDDLKQNSAFAPNEEIVIIESTVQSIENEILKLINNPEKLYSLSKKGREKFIKVYSNDVQIKPRIQILKNIIK
jgi:glycosyltransferase involved in cell wall biosynthesis